MIDMDRAEALSMRLRAQAKLKHLFFKSLRSESRSVTTKIKKATLRGKARLGNGTLADSYQALLTKYVQLPGQMTSRPEAVFRAISRDLFNGVPLWRSPNLSYNVGAPVNPVSSALYGTSLDLNVFNINDGLSGNTLLAEHAVVQILSELAGLDPKKTAGFFTFGGTATNLYALKLALQKNVPNVRTQGIQKGIKIALTEDAHFSHARIADWLGIGTDNILILPAQKDRTSSLSSAREILNEALVARYRIPLLILNGGTTYDHAIDDIEQFVKLREDLIQEHSLEYRPHIHIDSVIGWSWLFFRTYNFTVNPLGIEKTSLELIKEQVQRISLVSLADSWGVDFHKGIGSCPVPTSVIMVNERGDIELLAAEKAKIHQLAHEFSSFSPVDYTLETSRPAGAPLAALGALHTLGTQGFQTHLAVLVQLSQLLRELINSLQRDDIRVLNNQSRGYATMVKLSPRDDTSWNGSGDSYIKLFFNFDQKTRMSQGEGVEYSYSSKYIVEADGQKVDAIKFYPTSPTVTAKHIRQAVETLIKQKELFDAELARSSREARP